MIRIKPHNITPSTTNGDVVVTDAGEAKWMSTANAPGVLPLQADQAAEFLTDETGVNFLFADL